MEFNDRYAQAGTYGQLGILAAEQEQWTPATDYLLKALEIFIEFKDEYRVGVASRSLARVYQATADETIVQAVAGVLGVTGEEVREKWGG